MPIIYPPATTNTAPETPVDVTSKPLVPSQVNSQGGDTGEYITKGELDNVKAAISIIAGELAANAAGTGRDVITAVNDLLYPGGMKA